MVIWVLSVVIKEKMTSPILWSLQPHSPPLQQNQDLSEPKNPTFVLGFHMKWRIFMQDIFYMKQREQQWSVWHKEL